MPGESPVEVPGGSGIGVACKAPGQGGAMESGHRATARAWTAPICVSTARSIFLSHLRPFSNPYASPACPPRELLYLA